MSKENKRLFPPVRFEGYEEDWEQVKLKDALDYEQPTKYLVGSDDYSDSYDTPVLTAGKSFLLGYSDETDGVYDRGDVILFDDFTTAFHYIDFPFKVKSSATKFLTTISDDFCLRFVYEEMKGIQHPTESHKRYWISEFQELLRYMPVTNEQKQIGNFFKTLDGLISAEEEQLQSYEQYKSAMLQKMFPKKHEINPEVRFDGYDEDWEEMRLGDVLNMGSRERVEEPSNHRRLTVHLNGGGLSEYVPERELADTRPFYRRSSGEIIIGKQNYFNGSIAIVPDKFDKYIASNAIMSFSGKSNVFVDFLFTYISMDGYIRQREHLADGTGQKELSERNFLDFKMMLPTLEEQKQIGNFFKTIDELIRNKKEKIEQLKEAKESFLQKMFV